MNYLITSDLHFTNKPKDEYRFGLVPWLIEQAKATGASHLFILGDLTDEKDRHTGQFINRITAAISEIASAGIDIGINTGNHDYIDAMAPTFKFLSRTNKGAVRFYTKPTLDEKFQDVPIYWLPHQHDRVFKMPDDAAEQMGRAKYVFLHQTFDKARASNGQLMEGIPQNVLPKIDGKYISGDIHVPQTLGRVTYVGSPYHVHFGDNFKPRVVHIKSGRWTDLHFPCLRRVTVDLSNIKKLSELEALTKGDQVKVRVRIGLEEVHDWKSYRQDIQDLCVKLGLDLHGTECILPAAPKSIKTKQASRQTPANLFDTYCKKHTVDEHTRAIGEQLLESEVPAWLR